MSDLCQVTCLHPEALQKARGIIENAPLSRIADTFKVLGDRTRAGILMALKGGELCVCDLAELFKVTPGAISHQTRLLKAHRLVKARREGKMVFYSLDDEHVSLLLSQVADHAREV